MLSIEGEVADEVMERLKPIEKLVYFRLYRLSYGFRRDTTDPVGATAIARWCGISKDSVLDAYKSLVDKGLIALMERINTRTVKGSRWRVYTRIGEANAVGSQPTVGSGETVPQAPAAGHSPHVIDDDDSNKNKTDHHQRETMTLYENLTTNTWRKADDDAYQKIRHVKLDVIRQAIELAMNRAKTHPNSLEYFVKEIRRLANPSKKTRGQHKRELKKIVDAIRNLHVGARNYGIADLAEDVKRACIKEGLVFDNDLFSEILGIS